MLNRFLLIWLGLALALAACAGPRAAPAAGAGNAVAFAAGEATAPPATLPPTATPTPVPAVEQAPTAAIQPLPTQVSEPADAPGCGLTPGEVISVSVPSPTLRYASDARIYLPPCYGEPGRRYPVLYLLHGLG
ncbi:MAG: hypothetical protein JNK29_04180, partial [Anaerolineales bacterium]|nr:hypothetical protein [Anaerolineales bacterium]